MTANLIPFQFQSLTIRTVVIDDEVWWVGKDVCQALGYANPSDAMKQHCKGVAKRYPLQTAGGMQEVRVLSEADVLRLIVSSNLPEAQRFERWVFEEVLPTIRKTGRYAMPEQPAPILPAAKAFTALFKVARLMGLDRNVAAVSANQSTAHNTGVNLMRLLGHEELAEQVQTAWFTPTELGEMIKVTGRQFNLLLMEAGLQTKEGKLWLPADAAKGLFRWYGTGKKHGDGTLVQQLKWSRDVLPRLNQEAA